MHDLVLNLLNSLNFCGFSKFLFVVPFINKMADESRNPEMSITGNYGPARDASEALEHVISPEVACAIL